MQAPVNPDLMTLHEAMDTNPLNISRLEGVVSQLEKRIDNLEHEMRELRVELVGRIDKIHAKLRGRIDHFYTELRGRVDRLNCRVDRLNRELSERIDRSEERINKRLDRLETELKIGSAESKLSSVDAATYLKIG